MRRHFTLLCAALLCSACAAPAATRNFSGVVTHVTDGDTVWVRPPSGGAALPVRIEGIDAPEICQPHGEQARQAMAGQLLHQPVTVRSRRRDDYDRLLARVEVHGSDIGEWMVQRGHAWSYRYRRDPGPYAAEQSQARQARRGLWSASKPTEPRTFRRQHGSCHTNGH